MSDRAGKAADARRKRRTDAAIVREDRILQLYASGTGWDDMGAIIRSEFGGSFHGASLRRAVYRGLERRAAEQPEQVAVAREMLMMKAEALLTAHLPLALGTSTGIPDVRSGELALRTLNSMAEWLGVKKLPPSPTEIHNTVNIITPDNVHAARDAVLTSLVKEREKLMVVDGHLAAVGTSTHELEAPDEDDTMAPPPGVIPTQEAA